MAKRNKGMDILANQAWIATGGDINRDESWDPNQTGHHLLLNNLGGRITERAPLSLLWTKTLTQSDVSSGQSRFVFHREIVENSILRCLTSQQGDDLCNHGAEIDVEGFDERGRQWKLKLLKRMQRGSPNGTYVLIRDWTKMVDANGWGQGDVIKIWGLPYAAGREDRWRFGPDHDFSKITWVFTNTV